MNSIHNILEALSFWLWIDSTPSDSGHPGSCHLWFPFLFLFVSNTCLEIDGCVCVGGASSDMFYFLLKQTNKTPQTLSLLLSKPPIRTHLFLKLVPDWPVGASWPLGPQGFHLYCFFTLLRISTCSLFSFSLLQSRSGP